MSSVPQITYTKLYERMKQRRMSPAQLARLIVKPDGKALTGEGLRKWLNAGVLMPGYAIYSIAKVFGLDPEEIAVELLGMKPLAKDIPLDKAAARVLAEINRMAGGAA